MRGAWRWTKAVLAAVLLAVGLICFFLVLRLEDR